VAGARERSWRVLSCAPAESEVSLSFAGLADLLGEGFDEVAASLPAPQRRALRVALALEDAKVGVRSRTELARRLAADRTHG
jgi:hypothetical protein